MNGTYQFKSLNVQLLSIFENSMKGCFKGERGQIGRPGPSAACKQMITWHLSNDKLVPREGSNSSSISKTDEGILGNTRYVCDVISSDMVVNENDPNDIELCLFSDSQFPSSIIRARCCDGTIIAIVSNTPFDTKDATAGRYLLILQRQKQNQSVKLSVHVYPILNAPSKISFDLAVYLESVLYVTLSSHLDGATGVDGPSFLDTGVGTESVDTQSSHQAAKPSPKCNNDIVKSAVDNVVGKWIECNQRVGDFLLCDTDGFLGIACGLPKDMLLIILDYHRCFFKGPHGVMGPTGQPCACSKDTWLCPCF